VEYACRLKVGWCCLPSSMGVIEAASERLIAAGAASWRMYVPWIEIVDVLLSPRLEICMECR
jgi:hypothetical protein